MNASLNGQGISASGAGNSERASTTGRSDPRAVSGLGRIWSFFAAPEQLAATDGSNTILMTLSGKGFTSDPGKTPPLPQSNTRGIGLT